MKLAWKFLLVFAVSLITYDTFQDAAGGCASDPPGATACHNCVCGPHLVAGEGPVVALNLNPGSFVPFETSLFVSPLPESIFHPPKAST